MDWESIAKGLSALSPTALVVVVLSGLLFWLFWGYIPNLQKDFKASLAEAHRTNERQADAFRVSLEKMQADFLTSLKEERDSHSAAMESAVCSTSSMEKSMDRLTNAILASMSNHGGIHV